MACSKKSCGQANGLSNEHHQILSIMAANESPCGCKDIANECGMASQSVSCKLRSLKSNGYVDSPVRCKYTITEAGKAALAAA